MLARVSGPTPPQNVLSLHRWARATQRVRPPRRPRRSASVSPRGRRRPKAELRKGVFGSTRDDPQPHFLGWADDIDPDALFDSGEAWGLSVRLIAA